MPKMVVTHAVVDIEKWLRGKAERAGAYRQVRHERDGPRRRRWDKKSPSRPTSTTWRACRR